jgi:hypothetical protein
LDTAIIVGVIIGSVVAMVLVFGKTVLGVAWTENKGRKLREPRGNQIYTISTGDTEKLSYLQTQGKAKTNNFDSLLSNNVFTCDNKFIGQVFLVQGGVMSISNDPNGKVYEMPTYFLRERIQNRILMDISAIDLGHYEVESSYIIEQIRKNR